LGKSHSEGIAVARAETELLMLRDQKIKAEASARDARAKLMVVEKKLREQSHAAELATTRIKMQYEKQISILESRLLE